MSNGSRNETEAESINADSRKVENFSFFRSKRRTKLFHSLEPLRTSNCLVTNVGSKKIVTPQVKRKGIIGQYFLDLGQKDFSYSTCPVCGLFYARGLEGDESVHRVYHKNRTRGILFKGWQDERLVSKVDGKGNRVILVLPEDTHHRNKVKEVMAVVESELGLSPGWLIEEACKVYLFISNSRKVVGCLMAEPINTAFRVLPSKKQVRDRQEGTSATFGEQLSGGEATTWTSDGSITGPGISSEQKIDEVAGDVSEKLADVPGVSEVSLQAGNRNITARSSVIVKECHMSESPNVGCADKPGAGVSSSPLAKGTGVSTKCRSRKITEFFEVRSTPAGIGKENACSSSGLAWPVNSVASVCTRTSEDGGDSMPSSSGGVQVVMKDEVMGKGESDAVEKEHPDRDGDDLSVDGSVQKKPLKQVNVGENYLVFGNVKLKREVIPRKRAREEDLGSVITYNTTPISAVCGIRVIWVCNSERRKGIASHLVDAMRKTFCFGVVLEISQFAFSQPSSEGRKFAARYCKTDEFLVYTSN